MSTDAQNIPGSFPVVTREELEVSARDLITRFLGNPSGQSHDMARDLTDEELTEILAAGVDRHTARQAIKDVFTAAGERKRKSHSAEAQANQARLNERAKVLRVLASTGAPPEASQNVLLVLSPGERSILAQLDGETDIADVVSAVVNRAVDRTEGKVTVSTADGTLEPGSEKSDDKEPSSDVEGSNAVAEHADETPAAEPAAEAAAPPVVAEPAEPAAETPAVEATPVPAPAEPKPAKKPAKK